MDVEKARVIAEEVRTGNFKILAKTEAEDTIANLGIALVVLDDCIEGLGKEWCKEG